MTNWFCFAATLSVLLVVAVSDESVQKFENEPQLTVLHPNEIYDYSRFHPSVYVNHLTKTNVDGRIQYVLGARIASDNLVAHSAKNQTWPTQQNVAVTLTYPTSGVGKQVTFVAIQVDQATNFGQAYVISGGLHQRNIAIVVEAYTTNFLNYDAQVYGV